MLVAALPTTHGRATAGGGAIWGPVAHPIDPVQVPRRARHRRAEYSPRPQPTSTTENAQASQARFLGHEFTDAYASSSIILPPARMAFRVRRTSPQRLCAVSSRLEHIASMQQTAVEKYSCATR